MAEIMACKIILTFFQELAIDPSKNSENEESGRMIPAQEAFNRISEVLKETIRKMEFVAEEKMHLLKKARLSIEATDQELKDKTRKEAALKSEKQRKKHQIDELENIVRLKQAEAEMFDLKASEARREAERIQRINVAKSEKSEENYASRYLKQRLDEAEAEKQFIFEKLKLQESGGNMSQMMMYSKMQKMIKNIYNVTSEGEGKSNDLHSRGSLP